MNRDFAEMLAALSDAGAEYLVVGAHARAAYGEPRATKDFDIWIRPTPENARRVWRALEIFGAPTFDLRLEDFERPGITFQIGLPPSRIDLLTELTALEFDEAWPNRIEADFWGAKHPVIGKAEYVRNKRAIGRPQDLADAEHIERSPIE